MDTFSPEKRSEIMRRVRSKNTRPEILIGSLLHRVGFRFRKHRNDLPGKPDFVFPKYKAALFVHGCFWHRHSNCPHADTPASRQEYWLPKFMRTVERDRKNQEALKDMGWNVILAWECELRDVERLVNRLKRSILREYDNAAQTECAMLMAAEKKKRFRKG